MKMKRTLTIIASFFVAYAVTCGAQICAAVMIPPTPTPTATATPVPVTPGAVGPERP